MSQSNSLPDTFAEAIDTVAKAIISRTTTLIQSTSAQNSTNKVDILTNDASAEVVSAAVVVLALLGPGHVAIVGQPDIIVRALGKLILLWADVDCTSVVVLQIMALATASIASANVSGKALD